MTREQAFAQMRGVHDELEAARFAVASVQRLVRTGADALAGAGYRVRPVHISTCAENLDRTYVLRLFAEFEAVLRDYWAAVRRSPRPRRTRMEILMNRVAASRWMTFDVLNNAHSVREYRNAAVHNQDLAASLAFNECKSHLGTYLSHLPIDW